jgi:hypothetical protein
VAAGSAYMDTSHSSDASTRMRRRQLRPFRGLIRPFDPVDLYRAMRRWSEHRATWAMDYNLAVSALPKIISDREL